MDHLFVMTYGRSGSTLVQGLLNAIPGYLIRGENRSAVYSLYQFHRTCVEEAGQRNPTRTAEPTSAFFGITDFAAEVSVTRIRDLVVDTLLRPEADTRVSGFKEIRWYMTDLHDYVGFLRELFPGARFLVNTRDHAVVSRSKWWSQDDQARAKLVGMEERILEVAAALGDDSFRVHYDDYVADPDVLRGLYEWLGEPWRPDLVRATLAVRHSR